MDRALLILASIGIVLLWHRAEPLKPIRTFVARWLNRIWEWLVVGRRWCFRVLAWPLWWLKGVLGCAECMTPYSGVAVALIAGERWWAVPMGLAAYAIYILFDRSGHRMDAAIPVEYRSPDQGT